MTPLGRRAIVDAAARIADVVHRTPVMTCAAIDRIAGRRVYFKCENFQRTGSFKVRGALHAIRRLDARAASRGVVACSTGNHAQALAFAARQRGIASHVVVPRAIPAIKLAAIEGHGARVTFCDTTMALGGAAARIAADTGAALISSSEDPHAIAGQGTAALEFLEEVPELSALVCPVGGGGLLAGSCLAAGNGPHAVSIFGAEPAAADDAARSIAAGERLPSVTPPQSLADGLLVDLAERSWTIIRRRAAGVVTVGEPEIHDALLLVWERTKVLIEASSAVALAAVLSPSFRARHRSGPVGVVLTGGNTALAIAGTEPHECASARRASSR